jgi:hypothetical protein
MLCDQHVERDLVFHLTAACRLSPLTFSGAACHARRAASGLVELTCATKRAGVIRSAVIKIVGTFRTGIGIRIRIVIQIHSPFFIVHAPTDVAAVPPLTLRLVTWAPMSFSDPLVCGEISGRSSTSVHANCAQGHQTRGDQCRRVIPVSRTRVPREFVELAAAEVRVFLPETSELGAELAALRPSIEMTGRWFAAR